MSEDRDDDRTWVCGESYDHDLRLLSDRDGVVIYECRKCGAEIIENEEVTR